MNYLVKGKDEFSIRAKVKELIKKSEASNNNVIEYDGASANFNLGDILEECNTISFFGEKKCVLFKNPLFLEKGQEGSQANSIKNLFEYLNNANPLVDLIMYSYEYSLNNYSKYSKKLATCCQTFSFEAMKYDDYYNHGLNLIHRSGLKLSPSISKSLIEYSKEDLYLLKQNIEKLRLYGQPIDEKALNALVDVPFEENVFKLTDAIFSKNMNQALSVLNDFYANNIAPQYLVAIIASQLRFLNEISYLNDCHMTSRQIKDVTKANEFRIIKTLEIIHRFGNADFLKMLSDLSDLDQELKSNSNLDTKLRLELFIIEITRR